MIIINRHNYEEFFLLYVDNELAADERIAVERFVEENSDLGEELQMLQQATLPAEQAIFDIKEVLYKHQEGITGENYEENFLLYVDQELTKDQREEVEKFVLQHPSLQNEFTLLQQTLLEPETIVFPNKEELYKTLEKRGVITMPWLRMAAAAAVIGIMFFAWLSIDRGSVTTSSVEVATIDQPVAPATSKPAEVKPVIIDQQMAVVPEKKVSNVSDVPKQVARITKHNADVATSVKKAESVVQSQTTTQTVEATQLQEAKRKAFEEAIASAKITKSSPSTINENTPKAVAAVNHPSDENSSLATPVVYREIDTREDEQKTIYIGSAPINKNKLRGIFRKAAVLFERKNPDNDEERTLQIAGFEIKTK